MADWEEIKRLAADFQRTQTCDTLQRLSERNCIDIVKKLTDSNLIEVIYTRDGKEIVTPDYLFKEIQDEIYLNGGRIHLHDLVEKLNVDYQHVENKCKDLACNKQDEYSFILGQVIHSTYKNTLGKQVADHLIINGELSIAEFSKSLDLPSEFLLTIVKEMLPKLMSDYVVGPDERTYYTTDMMDKYKSIIAGTLSAITKPTSMASLLKRLDIPERIFVPIVEGFIKDGRIDATIENRLYIPSVYAREQNEWINNFYNSNFYIGYDFLSRMDIKQPKVFLRKKFPDGIQLKTCFVSQNLLSQVESLIEESIASNGFIDISAIVPSSLDIEDIDLLLQDIFKKNKKFDSLTLIFNRTNICSLTYIENCKRSFESLMQQKAQEHLKQGKLINHFFGGKTKETKKQSTNDEVVSESGNNNDQIEKTPKKKENDNTDIVDTIEDEDHSIKKSKGSRKSGGGTQGREIKQKAVKKKYIPGNKGKKDVDNVSDDEVISTKTPRSNKGRAARRTLSPERSQTNLSIKQQSKTPKSSTHHQEAISMSKEKILVFMEIDEMIRKLKHDSRGLEESTDEFFESIAKTMIDELNSAYEVLAKQTLDEFLKKQSEENEPTEFDEDEENVELVS